ncbi:MAG: hypothetical protein JNM17_33080 [Archangium sp.]|nr:hypothetical protein [Archangium sp.]
MLVAALLVLAAAPSVVSDDARDKNDSTLSLFATSLSGMSFQLQAPRNETRGFVVGARAGLHAQRPPLSNGGGRIGIIPTLSIRHDFGSQRTEWTGAVAISAEIWRIRIVSGVGYGLTSKPDVTPSHLFEISMAAGLKFGPVWTGINFDTLWRFSDGTRALHVTAQIGIEWEVQREIFR